MNRWLALAALLMVGSFTLATWSLWESHDSLVARTQDQAAINAERADRAARDRAVLCAATNRSTKALRAVLELGAAVAAASTDLTPAQKARSASFYRKALRLSVPIDCSLVDPPRKGHR